MSNIKNNYFKSIVAEAINEDFRPCRDLHRAIMEQGKLIKFLERNLNTNNFSVQIQIRESKDLLKSLESLYSRINSEANASYHNEIMKQI